MRTRLLHFPDDRIAGIVHSHWQMRLVAVDHAAVGFGGHHWRVATAEQRWFLTVVEVPGVSVLARRMASALGTAKRLHDLGLGFVIAPVPTVHGDVLVSIRDRHLVTLHPYVDGEAHEWGPYPDRASRNAVLDRLVALHTAPEIARHSASTDDLTIAHRSGLEGALADRWAPWRGGPYAESTRTLLEEHADRITDRLRHHDRLAADIRASSGRWVVTHGEPHRANTITATEGVVLVDWDTALIAPRERDLWWLAVEDNAMVGEYQRLTGINVDHRVLAFYQLGWDLGDLAAFVAQFRETHDDDADTRTAWEALIEATGRITR